MSIKQHGKGKGGKWDSRKEIMSCNLPFSLDNHKMIQPTFNILCPKVEIWFDLIHYYNVTMALGYVGHCISFFRDANWNGVRHNDVSVKIPYIQWKYRMRPEWQLLITCALGEILFSLGELYLAKTRWGMFMLFYFSVCLKSFIKQSKTLLHFIRFQGILQVDLRPWLGILVSLKAAPGWGGNVWCCASSQRTMHTGACMITTVGHPMSRTVEEQWGESKIPMEWQKVAEPSTCPPRFPFLGHHRLLLGWTLGSYHVPDLLFPGKRGSDACLLAVGL